LDCNREVQVSAVIDQGLIAIGMASMYNDFLWDAEDYPSEVVDEFQKSFDTWMTIAGILLGIKN
jgi:hypothetical protein